MTTTSDSDSLSPERQELLARLRARRDAAKAAPPLLRLEGESPVRASFQQERFYLLERLRPGEVGARVATSTFFRGPLDLTALEAALTHILELHPTLRTRFVEREGSLWQEVVPATPVKLTPTALPRDGGSEACVNELLAEPLSLEDGRLVAFRLLRHDDETHELTSLMHHVATDGLSLAPLIASLAQEYEARTSGRTVSEPPKELRYVDYAAWQRAFSDAGGFDQSLTRQVARLSGYTDFNLANGGTLRGERRRDHVATSALDPALEKHLLSLGRSLNTTPAALLLAALTGYLSRLFDRTDIAIAVPFSGRHDPRLATMVGPFLNTLVVRTDTSGNPTVRDLVLRTGQALRFASDHGDVPFERIVAALGAPRSAETPPLVSTLYNWLDHEPAPFHSGALEIAHRVVPTSMLAHLALVIHASSSPWRIEIHMDPAKVDAEDAGRHRNRFLTFLAAFADEHAELSALPMHADSELSELLRVGQGPSLPALEGADSVLDLIARQASLRPHKTALVDNVTSLTYAQLMHAVDRLAARLVARGVKPSDRVGIALPRGVELPVAMLAVMGAGATSVPLDPDWPQNRLKSMVDDAGVGLIVCGDAPLPFAHALTERCCLFADDHSSKIERLPAAEIAWIHFTSGSEGRPKGVRVRNASFTNLVRSLTLRIGLNDDDVLLATTPCSFDIADFEVLGPLTVGATVVVAATEDVKDNAKIAASVDRHGVTFMQATPSTWRLLLTLGFAGHPKLRILSGGEALDATLAHALLERAKTVWNLYGPTETTVWSTAAELVDDEITVGTPLHETRVTLVDGSGRLTPYGMIGEVAISGAGVADGYVGHEEEASRRFRPLPDGTPAFFTGDRGRFDSKGRLQLLGRTDRQVKVRGHRVELAEVEAVLREAALTHDAWVAVDPLDDERLVGVVAGAKTSMESIRLALRTHLPDAMSPQRILELETLPTTPSGKLDHRALTALFRGPRAPEEGPPSASLRRTIAHAFGQVLGSEVNERDDFFLAGGHSIAAARLATRVSAATNADVTLRDIFDHPTIRGLADALEARGVSIISDDDSEHSEDVASVPSDKGAQAKEPAELSNNTAHDRAVLEDGAPAGHAVSFAQERLLFLERLTPNTPVYNLAVGLHIEGPLDIAALEATLALLVARHEPLRTAFAFTENAVLPVPVAAIVAIPPRPATERTLPVLIDAEAHRTFDLERDAPCRFSLFQVSPDRHVLVVVIHHVAADDWSFSVLAKELSTTYTALRRQEPPPLLPLPILSSEVAEQERRDFANGKLDAALLAWRETLSGAPEELTLPLDHPRPPLPSRSGAIHAVVFQKELTESIDALAAREKTTRFAVILAAWSVLLSRLSGQDEVVIASSVARRESLAKEALVGYFVNTVPLRIKVADHGRFLLLLAHATGVVRDALSRAEVPYDRILNAASLQRDPSRPPLASVAFELLNEPMTEATLDGLSVQSFAIPIRASRYDLSLRLFERDGLAGFFEFDTDLFEPATVARMAGYLTTLLHNIVEDPGVAPDVLSIVTDAERDLVLTRWTNTQFPYPRQKTLIDLFEKVVARDGSRIAVVIPKAVLTFQHLDSLANRVAHALIAGSIAPGDPVGIFMERSPQALTALLGVLKAGAVIVPLMPSDPVDRLRRHAERVGVKMIISKAPESHRAKELGLPVLDVIAERAELRRLPASSPSKAIDPAATAIIWTTSGTTGAPKAVATSHRNLVNYLNDAAERFGAAKGAGAPWFTSMGVDLTVTSLFAPLLSSNAVHVLSAVDPLLELAELASKQPGFSFVKMTPSHLAALFGLLNDGPYLGFTGTIILGGEAVNGSMIRRARELFPDATVFNEYGPTEATVGCTLHRVSPETPVTEGPTPIGKPMANTIVRVLDRRMEPVPIGVVGELYIGGDGITSGYVHDDERNQVAFVNDPFRPGERLYCSGDRARWRADGSLVFVGRTDGQLKIRGHRIERAELEAALTSLQGVRAAYVDQRRARTGQKQLVAWISLEEHRTPERLMRGLARTLPKSHLPDALLVLDDFIAESSGKVARERLPSPWTRSVRGPSTAESNPLCEIFATVLGLDVVHGSDDFFSLGGDSILALRVVARARQQGIGITTQDVFIAPTPRELIRMSHAVIPLLRDVQNAGPVPLTPALSWYLRVRGPERAPWSQAVSLLVGEPVDVQRLRMAFDAVFRHHEALRLRVDRSLEARLLDQSITSLQVLDFPEDRDDAHLLSPITRLRESLDLENGPLSGVILRRRRPAPDLLIWALHHAVVDGVSWRILIQDLETAYRAITSGVAPELPITTPYRTAVEAVRRDFERPTQDIAPLPYEDRDGGHPQRHHRVLDVETTSSFLSRCREDSLSLESELLLALADAVAPGHGGVSMDVEHHGRGGSGDVPLHGVVGWFTAIHPILVPAVGDREQRRLRLATALDVRHRAAHAVAPRSSIRFNFHGEVDRGQRSNGLFTIYALDLGPDRPASAPRTHRWEVDLLIRSGQLAITFDHDDSVSPATVARFLDRFSERLSSAPFPSEAAELTIDPRQAPLTASEAKTILMEVEPEAPSAADATVSFELTAEEKTRLYEALPTDEKTTLLPTKERPTHAEAQTEIRAIPSREDTGVDETPLDDLYIVDPTAPTFQGEFPTAETSITDSLAEAATLAAIPCPGIDFTTKDDPSANDSGVDGAPEDDASVEHTPVAALSSDGTPEDDAPSAYHPAERSPAVERTDAPSIPEGEHNDAIEDRAPLTPTQQGMLFHSLLHPESLAYREQLTTTLRGPLDSAALVAALADLVADVDVLRAAILHNDERDPELVIYKRVVLPLQEVQFPMSEDAGREVLAPYLERERALPFDFEVPPLARALLLRHDAERHTFVFTYHHVLLDGWSMPVLLERLRASYARHAGHATTILPPSPRFTEFARWLRGIDHWKALAWFSERLHDFERPHVLVLRDETPSLDAESEFHVVEQGIGKHLSELILDQARALSVTPSVIFQTAWAILLGRYDATDDVVFGLTVSGRPDHLEDAHLRVGPFLNTLPVRVRLNEDATVTEQMSQVGAAHAELMGFQHTPLPLSQQTSSVPSRTPLFNSLVVVENYPVDPTQLTEFDDLEITHGEGFERTSYPLTLIVIPGERLILRLLASRRWMRRDQADAMLEHLKSIVRTLASEPDIRLRDLRLLAPHEEHALLHDLSGADIASRDIDPERFDRLPERFRRAAKLYGPRLAIIEEDRSFRFDALDKRADQVATALRARGVVPHDVIGLVLPRGADLVTLELAIMRLRAVFFPLDPADAGARSQPTLKIARCRFLVSAASLSDSLCSLDIPVLTVEELVGAALEPMDIEEFPEILGEDPAYCIATSGSTGTPNVVQISHRALAYFVGQASMLYSLDPKDRVLLFASPAFDTSLEEIWPPLVKGATLVPRTDECIASTAAFVTFCRERDVTVLDLPTAFWHALTEGMNEALASALTRVRLVILGGEAASASVLATWRARFGDAITVINTYGPTECTVITVTSELTQPRGAVATARVPIGRPLPGTEAFVLDRRLRPVPEGAAGELCLSGPSLALGYIDNRKLESERFVPHPLDRDGERLYRTGDRVRFREDGELEFLGRLDDQIKVRGHRVEPSEVAQVFAQRDGVADAIILPITKSDGTLDLIAFIVEALDAALDPALLREEARRHLPAALVPSRVVLLDAFPLTVRGKIDRAQLEDLARDGGEATRTTAPRGELEATLASLMGQVLDRSMGRDDDFFESGGNSLLALRFADAVASTLGSSLSLGVLFSHSTPATLAVSLSESEPADPASDAPALDAFAVLPEDVRPAHDATAASSGNVLLTGATGFLGSHLLSELLKQSVGVTCLIRAKDADDGRRRLARTMASFSLEADLDRVEVIAAHLDRPGLGLDTETLLALSANTARILHCAASTSFLAPLQKLLPANVTGTLELLRLATLGPVIPFHFVSTVSVLDAPLASILEVDETLPLAATAHVRGGYAQSKWIAEQLVRAAHERGVPIAIYRPGRLVGGNEGASPNDLAHQLFQAAIEARALPDHITTFDVSPVDWVARSLLSLIGSRAAAGQTWHLLQSTPTRTTDVLSWLDKRGIVLEPMTWDAFENAIRRAAARNPSGPSAAVSPLLPMLRPASHEAPRVVAPNTLAALPERIRPVPLDEARFDRLLLGLDPK